MKRLAGEARIASPSPMHRHRLLSPGPTLAAHGRAVARWTVGLLWLGALGGSWAAEPAVRRVVVQRVEANRCLELKFTSAKAYADPFNNVQLDAWVTAPDGESVRAPGFWDGGNVWRLRYASGKTGRHTYRTECSDAANADLHGVAGAFEVTPYRGENPLFRHGPVRVAADRRHVAHADGTPFFWLGDTWWMGLCHRLRWPEEFQRLTADRRAKGFNVIQIVAGLYPDMPPFDPRGANEAGFPWETNYARVRPEYFAAADQRLGHLVEAGLTPCIVGAWGYFLPWMGVEKAKQHWRYLIARYGAGPVVWCIAGEANLPYYLTKGFPFDDREQVHGWTAVTRYVRETDPFHRLVTIHPTAIRRYTARHTTDDPGLLDVDMLQTPHGQQEAVPVTVRAVRESYQAAPVMPVINGEASYEMLSDSLPTRWTRTMFWLCLLNGAAGHTYGANGIWQCNRPGQPHGASPHGGSYGKIAWDEAMRLPGSTQLSRGKRLLEAYPWQRFEPHPEWAAFAAAATTNQADGPQAAGIPGGVRLVYAPKSEAVVVRAAGPGAAWLASRFDPVTGEKTALGEIHADAAGTWTWTPPSGPDQDWLLILEPKGR